MGCGDIYVSEFFYDGVVYGYYSFMVNVYFVHCFFPIVIISDVPRAFTLLAFGVKNCVPPPFPKSGLFIAIPLATQISSVRTNFRISVRIGLNLGSCALCAT